MEMKGLAKMWSRMRAASCGTRFPRALPWAVVCQAVGLEEVCDAVVDLLEKQLVLGLEIGVAEALELELADVVLEILEGRDHFAIFIGPRCMPARTYRHEKGLAVGGFVFEEFGQQLGAQMGKILFDGSPLEFELIGEAFEKQHSEDEFLELRGIHLPAKDVGRLEEEGFELGKGDFFSGHEMGNRGASNSAERVRRHVNHQRPSDYLREAPIEPFRRRMESLILGLETFPSGKPAWPPLGRRSEGLAAPDKLRRATHPPEAPGPQSHGPNQLPATSSTPNTVMPASLTSDRKPLV